MILNCIIFKQQILRDDACLNVEVMDEHQMVHESLTSPQELQPHGAASSVNLLLASNPPRHVETVGT
jgi:hypothetical protein